MATPEIVDLGVEEMTQLDTSSLLPSMSAFCFAELALTLSNRALTFCSSSSRASSSLPVGPFILDSVCFWISVNFSPRSVELSASAFVSSSEFSPLAAAASVDSIFNSLRCVSRCSFSCTSRLVLALLRSCWSALIFDS